MDVDQVLSGRSVALENGHVIPVLAIGRAVQVGLHDDVRAILHEAGKIRRIVGRVELTVQQRRQIDDVFGVVVGDGVDVGRAGFGKDKSIVAAGARQNIVTGAADYYVVTGAASYPVIASSADQEVGAPTPGDGVISCVAEDQIPAEAAGQRVVGAVARSDWIAGTTVKRVSHRAQIVAKIACAAEEG